MNRSNSGSALPASTPSANSSLWVAGVSLLVLGTTTRADGVIWPGDAK